MFSILITCISWAASRFCFAISSLWRRASSSLDFIVDVIIVFYKLQMINDLTIITININSSRLTINIVVNFVVGETHLHKSSRVCCSYSSLYFPIRGFLTYLMQAKCEFLRVKVAKGVNYFGFSLIIIFEK